MPSNCGAILSGTPLTSAPSGGLSGTLTLINVASGMDFTLNPEALDRLAQRPFFRGAADPYPDFNAAEIDPVSVVTTNGATYRSVWNRPVDAVSAALMRSAAMGEYTLDSATFSQTDFVLTLPTRHFYTSSSGIGAPFGSKPPPSTSLGSCEEPLTMTYWNRDEQSGLMAPPDFSVALPDQSGVGICGVAGVASIGNAGIPAAVVGAVSSMTSTAASTRIDAASGQATAGAHKIDGLPMLGFSARTFRNGTLRCDAGSCQGNYGGAFPFNYRRNITPAS